MKYAKIRSVGVLYTLLFSMLLSSCAQEEKKGKPAKQVAKKELSIQKQVKNYEIVKIDYDKFFAIAKKKSAAYQTINLQIKGHANWNFKMKNDDLNQYFASDFEMIEIGEKDKQVSRQMHEVYAMEGYLNTTDQKVIMTFGQGRMEALITVGGIEYSLEPLFNYNQKAPKDSYILYRGNELLDNNYICISDEQSPSSSHETLVEGKPWKVNLTFLGDYQFYTKFTNAADAYNYMYWRFYYANKRYNLFNDIGIHWQLRTAYLYTWLGSANYNPKTSSNKQIFGEECSAYYKYDWYRAGDVNYFFTGDDVEGVIGRAGRIAALCKTPAKAFAFGEWRSSAYQAQNLMAHEIGHVMGCAHDNTSDNFMNKNSAYWNATIGIEARDNILTNLECISCLSK